MKIKILPFLIILLFFSCIFTGNNISMEEIQGCYLTSIPDPYSPDDNPPMVELYIQLWDDGTGEGGFWNEPLTESNFFRWELDNDTLRFLSDFELLDDCVYYIQENDSTSFTLIAECENTNVASFYLSEEEISHIDFNNDQIVGSWNSSYGGTIYTFNADGTLNITGHTPTTWIKGSIPYIIETGYGSQWAVRMYNDHLVIMAGYNNILVKQP